MSTESFSPYNPYTQPLLDPYAPLLDPYAPTPTPKNDASDESDGNCCLGKAIDACNLGPAGELIAAYGLIAGVAFVIGALAAAIFGGPILATGLWLAGSITISAGVLHAITVIGKELNWREESSDILGTIAVKLIILASLIIGFESGVL